MGSVIELLGVPGVGKSTIGKLAVVNTDYQFIDSADIILAEARKLGLSLTSHDEIPLIPEKNLIDILHLTRKRIEEISSNNKLLLDGYLNIRIGRLGYWLLTPDVLRSRKTIGIIIVIASPSQIIKWRKKNANSRKRSIRPFFEISIEQSLIIDIAVRVSMDLGIPLKVVYNREGALDKAVKEVKEFIIGIEELYSQFKLLSHVHQRPLFNFKSKS